ncbi:putative F-box/LRR-repeat protein At5g41840 [Argentina anserina]|uniref:putative F-box/LRR-repeat protein At5g41840 n=1 Tax=Argentina anserina TaxID=57926 RepID=UPI002176586D|nr:putative F-box/LRR-repeat protein At5g41840 [Potentilla anserina]
MEKRQVQDGDRINASPDALCCHILSFLPTIDAVRTTVLSPRWKNLWTSVPNIEIQDDDASSNIAFSRFRFSLISRWVETAVRHTVVELELSLPSDPSDSRIFELPQCLLMCKTLGVFPALKSLNVSFDSVNASSIQNIFSHFPLLEDLTLRALFRLNELTEDFNVNIFSPNLKRDFFSPSFLSPAASSERPPVPASIEPLLALLERRDLLVLAGEHVRCDDLLSPVWNFPGAVTYPTRLLLHVHLYPESRHHVPAIYCLTCTSPDSAAPRRRRSSSSTRSSLSAPRRSSPLLANVFSRRSSPKRFPDR